MNNLQQALLAKQLITLLSNDINVGIFENNGSSLDFKEYKRQEMVENLLSSGLSPFLVIPDEKNSISFLITEVWKGYAHHDDKKLFLDAITPEMISEISYENAIKILRDLEEQVMNDSPSNAASVFFEKGFKLKQGTDDQSLDYQMAIDAHCEYFEAIVDHKQHFDFNRKYKCIDGDFTLAEIIKLELDEISPKSSLKRKLENTLLFVTNMAKLGKYNELNETLRTNETIPFKQKI